MKVIKFRILGMDGIGGWSYFKIPDDIAQWEGNVNLFYDDEKTLCQYTELLDKNEKEIFINDIMPTSFGNAVIKIDNLSDGAYLEFQDGTCMSVPSKKSDREIIGNINENKNLIEEKN